MLDDKNLWRNAFDCVKQLGDRAEGYALERLEDMRRVGDDAGQETWTRLLAAIRALLDAPAPMGTDECLLQLPLNQISRS